MSFLKKSKSKSSKSRSNKKPSLSRKILRSSGRSKFMAFIFVALFASIGAGLIIQSFAASPDYAASDVQIFNLAIFRQQNGKPGLFRSKCLSQAAQDWANHMADTNNLVHSGFSTVAPRCGNNGANLGENVGVGPSSSSIFNAFVASPGHNANMRGNWSKVGIGSANGNGRLWVVQLYANAGGGAWDTPYAPPTKIVGKLDSATCARVKGWAFNSGNSSAPIAVDVYFADSKGTQGIRYNGTNVLRNDVNSAYKISGKHGFDMGVPLDWQGRTFLVTAYGIDNSVNPSLGVKGVACHNRALDSNTRTQISGWAFDYNRQSEKLQIIVHYSFDGKTWAQYKPGTTTVSRPSVNSTYKISGTHGFQFNVPSSFYNKAHWTRIYARNSAGETITIGSGYTF